jgi:hypothetical protein
MAALAALAALAAELPKGLAAVALNPRIIDTRMLRSSFGGAVVVSVAAADQRTIRFAPKA